MPFGLCNAAQNLAKLMDLVLGYDLEPKVFIYFDDIIVATALRNIYVPKKNIMTNPGNSWELFSM